MWERGWSFIKKAGTIILLSTIVIWFTSSLWLCGRLLHRWWRISTRRYPGCRSVSAVAWIFAPLGFGDWQAAVASITGLVAKENVVSTFGVLFGFAEVAEDGAEVLGSARDPASSLAAGYSFLVFNLLCAPCFAAMGAIKREMNNTRWTLIAVGYQTVFAYAVSLCIYQFGTLLTGGGFGIGTIAAVAVAAGFLWLLTRPDPQKKKAAKVTGSPVAAD